MKNLEVARLLATDTLISRASWYAIPLRLVIGFGFMQHGYAKMIRGPDQFVHILAAMGLPFSVLLGYATILVEFIGGFMVFAGVLLPLVSIPMIVVLLVAIFTVHLPNGFSSIKLMSFDSTGAHFGQPGYETDLLYIAGLIALCIGGSGPMSLNSLLLRRTAPSGSAR